MINLNPFSMLGVSPTATPAEITHAYRRQLRDHHPDMRSQESNSAADEQLRQVLEAYALLRDPHQRTAYDRAHPVDRYTGPVSIRVTHNDPSPTSRGYGQDPCAGTPGTESLPNQRPQRNWPPGATSRRVTPGPVRVDIASSRRR